MAATPAPPASVPVVALDTPQWLTPKQVAAVLAVHPETVRRMIRHGDLPCRRLSARALRVPASAVAPAGASQESP